jgi:hypothetical protein
MSRFALALASLLALALSAPGAAGVMSTGPAFSGSSSSVSCVVQNLDTKDHTVTATIVRSDGTILLGPSAVSVSPGNVVEPLGTGAGSPYVFCQFEGLSRKVRGWIAVGDGGGLRTALPATR